MTDFTEQINRIPEDKIEPLLEKAKKLTEDINSLVEQKDRELREARTVQDLKLLRLSLAKRQSTKF